jgi:hypothetical protein
VDQSRVDRLWNVSVWTWAKIRIKFPVPLSIILILASLALHHITCVQEQKVGIRFGRERQAEIGCHLTIPYFHLAFYMFRNHLTMRLTIQPVESHSKMFDARSVVRRRNCDTIPRIHWQQSLLCLSMVHRYPSAIPAILST